MVNFLEMAGSMGCSKGLSGCEHLIGVTIDLYTSPNLGDVPIGANQNRGAKNPEEASAIHGFLTPCSVGFEHLMFFVRYQRHLELVLVAKFLLRLLRIGGDAEHFGTGAGEVALEAREVDRLPGATRRIGAGIEEQHQFLAGKIRLGDHPATIAW